MKPRGLLDVCTAAAYTNPENPIPLIKEYALKS